MDFSRQIFCTYFLALVICSIKATPVEDLSKGMAEFSTELYLQCVKEKPGNVVVSPLSVSNALVLLSQGTAGSTFEQLRQGLHLGNDKSITANQFLEHRKTLEKNAGAATLEIANKIYIQEGRHLNKHFEEVAVSKFNSGVEIVNFAESIKCAEKINNFVEERTSRKIKDLIKPDQLDADTRSVLVNAIYFKAPWEQPFNPEYTHKSDFHNSETDEVSVDFMYKDSQFNVAKIEELDATALELKYANSSMSFVFVLPNSGNGLSSLEAKLEDFDLAKVAEKLQPRRYEIHIPKFKVEYEIKLNDVLKNLGITEIFSDNANLGDLLESNEALKVSDVVHKAFLEIDEIGSEAAASTAIEITLKSMPPTFIVDHPFMFYIRETETNTVIFNGRVQKL